MANSCYSRKGQNPGDRVTQSHRTHRVSGAVEGGTTVGAKTKATNIIGGALLTCSILAAGCMESPEPDINEMQKYSLSGVAFMNGIGNGLVNGIANGLA